MKELTYCCDGFSWLISDKGMKGFSVLPAKIDQKNCFVLQGRSHDLTDESGKQTLFQMTIHFCPCCGADLSLIISANKNEIEDFIEENKHLLIWYPVKK
jgi:hypothetical protein